MVRDQPGKASGPLDPVSPAAPHVEGDGHGALVCAVCGEDHPFEMPPELLAAALDQKLVVFAGAGISTESQRAVGDTFAARIIQELDAEAASALSFPQLMTEYERRFGRRQLLQRVRGRLDYIKGFVELQRAATRFHRELSTAFFLGEIVTTNWDTYFEEYAAATPIVIPADYAFWDLPGRKVFKLHGSMHNLSTLIATEEDYARCYRSLRTGTIGSSLKHLLATRRVVFIGYSFGDSDLARIMRFMKRELGDLLPRSFVVTPHGYTGGDFPSERVIRTDGSHFIRKLKEAAIEQGAMRPDSVYDVVSDLAERVAEARYRAVVGFRPAKHPAVIYTWAYQDGVLHAVERIMALRSSGHYSDPSSVRAPLHTYQHARDGAIRSRNYWDAAYIDGYMNGLLSVELERPIVEQTPIYFVWGSDGDMLDFKEFSRELRKAATLHKAATTKAQRIVRSAAGYDPVHTPFLDVPGLVAASRSMPRGRVLESPR